MLKFSIGRDVILLSIAIKSGNTVGVKIFTKYLAFQNKCSCLENFQTSMIKPVIRFSFLFSFVNNPNIFKNDIMFFVA